MSSRAKQVATAPEPKVKASKAKKEKKHDAKTQVRAGSGVVKSVRLNPAGPVAEQDVEPPPAPWKDPVKNAAYKKIAAKAGMSRFSGDLYRAMRRWRAN